MPALRLTTVSLLAAGALSAAVLPVHAQDEGSPDSGELIYQVQELLEEVRELRGMVESQQREIENLRRRQRDQYLDLDQRLQQLDRSPPVRRASGSGTAAEAAGEGDDADDGQRPPAGGDAPEVRAPIDAPAEITPLPAPTAGEARDLESPGEEEQADYDRAFRALREGRYADAAEGFSAFVDDYPRSSYAPNALYWLAETYYVTEDFDTALGFFNELLERYPDSNKEGDALLKIGFCQHALENWNEARAALEQVRSEFPGTTLARLAESRLRDMRLAGHY